MARSHHRKKHKTHVRQFKQGHDTNIASNEKGKAAWIFAIAGAVAGFAISYFASNGTIIWVLLFTFICGAAGYYVGNRMDKTNIN